jgi:hypothetical protein
MIGTSDNGEEEEANSTSEQRPAIPYKNMDSERGEHKKQQQRSP